MIKILSQIQMNHKALRTVFKLIITEAQIQQLQLL